MARRDNRTSKREKRSRRQFLGDVGKGMLVAGVGSSLAFELDLIPSAFAAGGDPLQFGELESLVDRMEETPIARLQPALKAELDRGTSLKTLVAAGALANARAFAGEDYEGYHTLMALVPAYEIAEQLPSGQQALPIFKVLYRNTARIQGAGLVGKPRLHKVEPAKVSFEEAAKRLRGCSRQRDMAGAEAYLARMVATDPAQAYQAMQPMVHDDYEVHRIVLAWRAWDVLRLTGMEHAETLLRQAVHFCVKREDAGHASELRRLLPELLEQHALFGREIGKKKGDAAWVKALAKTIFRGSRAEAARAVASALAEGFDAESIGQAMSLAATSLLLHDPGRNDQGSYGRSKGSVHGASVGVHAADSVNAWRAIARVSNTRNAIASLIVGAYHTAGQKRQVSDDPFHQGGATEVDATDPKRILGQLDDAVTGRDQRQASRLIAAYAGGGHPVEPVFQRLVGYAVSEDGSLHAEKYFRTVQGEFASTVPELRWQHVIALARVTASEYGTPAPGRDQARELFPA